ncbi:unnamed protein product [Adineta steineri]|nr:unnamed protein product [Adineta steineri]
MLPSLDNAREGFLCPQCHQDMSSMESLQLHFQTVHMKQSSSTTKGSSFLSFAKQKIKNVQENLKKPTESLKPYAQYFSFTSNDLNFKQQYMGYIRSHNESFTGIRKHKHDEMFKKASELLLRVDLLTMTNEHVPPNGNSKERRKYEQGIVSWMEDTVSSVCVSCSKSFGLSRRKHHCRLDGHVICQQCSQLFSFSLARNILDLNTPSSSTNNSIKFQKLTNVTSIISPTNVNNGSNDQYLRICLPCTQIIQQHFNQIRYKHIPTDEIFTLYEKIIQALNEYTNNHPTYSAIVDSLLNGDTKYHIMDAKRTYRDLSIHYEKIDSTSKLILKLADNDKTSDNRYAILCRNIRTYSLQSLQNFAISTKRIPTEDDIKRACDEKKRLENERMAQFASTIPGLSGYGSGIPVKLEPFVHQYYQVTQFLEQAKLDGRREDIESLEMNLKELERAINAIQHK